MHESESGSLRLRRWAIGVATVIAAALLPWLLGGYAVFQLAMALSYSIVLMGLIVLAGFSGQVSLGHGAFYAIGAYTVAILTTRFGVPYWAALPVAAAAGFVAGILLGLPALRLKGHHLALATFALAVATPQLLRYRRLEGWTGGIQGLVLDKPDAPGWLSAWLGSAGSPDRWLYWLTLALTIVMYAAACNLLTGRTRRSLLMVRDNPIAATAMGVRVAHVKTIAFGISSLYAAIGGALGALLIQFVSPDTFAIFLSLSLLVGAIVGGLGHVGGAFAGAVFVQFVPTLAGDLSKAAPWAVYGALLIITIYAMPGGIAGGLADASNWLRRHVSGNRDPSVDDSPQFKSR